MHPRQMVVACSLVVAASLAVNAETIRIGVATENSLTAVARQVETKGSLVQAAVEALLVGPTTEEKAAGYSTFIPAGTQLVRLDEVGDKVTADLSLEVLKGLDEYQLMQIFEQFKITFIDFDISAIRLTCQDLLLSSYLPVSKPVEAAPVDKSTLSATKGSLSGRNITIGPSHGRFWNGSGWYWQRSWVCDAGENLLEDTNSIRLMQFLYQYLTQDGATVHVPRELNESNCCHSETGYPWWKMCAQSWLRANGLPCSVWAAYSGACGAETDAARSSDDIRARPLFADYRGSDIYIAHHTNAGGSGTANGTETFRDTEMEHPDHETNSYNLAVAVQNSVIDAIRTTYPGESGWASRGVKDSAGGFGEIRVPNRPAILIELAFHDNCTRDGIYLQDNFFRSIAEWGIYKGVCQYFGTSPAWDKYSDEFVSSTIPAEMTQGQVYNVSVTFRNRGVVWSEARSFRLGTVDESDPFTSFTRVNISGEVRPGDTYTFNFQMTAPAPGDYVSDWRMVRDGTAWFGATHTKNIHVTSNIVDTEPPTTPTNLVANATGPTSVQLNWTASTDNVGVNGYDIRRNGTVIAQSATNSYTDNTAAAGMDYSYDVRAYDAVPNYSSYSNVASVRTPVEPTIVFSDGFDGNLNNWTQGTQSYEYSTTVSHGAYTGGGAAYMGAGQSDQMYHNFGRPFAQGKVSGWFYDGKGGWKASSCGNAYRQTLSLRNLEGTAGMFIDNGFYSASDNAKYFYRTVGTGGVTHTAYATRNASTDCNPAWIYFETTVNAGAPGGLGTIQTLVTDGAGTTTAAPAMTSNFYDYGIGRVTLGLGVTSAGEGYWDDIAFEATQPEPPTMAAPTALSDTQIRWNFTPADNNVFGFDVADAAGTKVAPQYSASGWLGRTATSWTETGLTPNTEYSRKVLAWNGTLNSNWSAVVTGRTLSVAPGAASVTFDKTTVCPTQSVIATAVGGLGAGTVQYYRYAWDRNATHTFAGDEPMWSSGTLSLDVTAGGGTWYLHVQGYNAADVANGAYDYALPIGPTVVSDFDVDCDVDQDDFTHFESCATGSNLGPPAAGCANADLDGDTDIDQVDFGLFQRCISGEGMLVDPACAE